MNSNEKFFLLCLLPSFIYEDYDNPPYYMQGPLMTHPTYRSPCNHEFIFTKLINENTYLTCENKIFTLIMLKVVEANALMLPSGEILVITIGSLPSSYYDLYI